jgi:hypothetical protein
MIPGRSPLAATPLAALDQPMGAATVLRAPVFSRYTPRDPMAALISQPAPNIAALAPAVIYPATFGLYDWPVPKGPVGVIDLKTITQGVSLSNQIGFINVPRAPVFSRFNAASFFVSLLPQSPNTTPLISNIIYPATFGLFDWPVPKGPAGAADLRTWLQSASLPQKSATPVVFGQHDWPVPKGPPPVDLRNWIQGISLGNRTFVVIYPASFGQYNWPNPIGPLGAKNQAFLWQYNYPTGSIVPPIVIPSGARGIYYFSANYAQRPYARQDMGFYTRYIKQSDSPIWSASFYDKHGLIVSTAMSVTLTVNYETRSGSATDVLPMTQNGIFWNAQWVNAAISLGRSTATWTISAPSLGVTTSGFFRVFSNFPAD